MHTAILITEVSFKLEDFKRIPDFSFNAVFKENEMVSQRTHEKESYISVVYDNGLYAFWEEDMQQKINSKFLEFNSYTVYFFSFTTFRKMIMSLPNDYKIFIDNDYVSLIDKESISHIQDFESFTNYKDCI